MIILVRVECDILVLEDIMYTRIQLLIQIQVIWVILVHQDIVTETQLIEILGRRLWLKTIRSPNAVGKGRSWLFGYGLGELLFF